MMMMTIVAVAHSSYAQEVGPVPTRIVVNVAAPIYVQPDAKLVPLRTAAVGSMLNVQIGEGGGTVSSFRTRSTADVSGTSRSGS